MQDAEKTAFVSEYLAAKADADRANARLNKAQAELLTWMKGHRSKTIKMELGDEEIAQLTYVQATRYEINEKGLRRALRARVYDRYTERKLNRKALEAAIDRGEVDPMVVAQHTVPVVGKPFIKYTVAKGDEDVA